MTAQRAGTACGCWKRRHEAATQRLAGAVTGMSRHAAVRGWDRSRCRRETARGVAASPPPGRGVERRARTSRRARESASTPARAQPGLPADLASRPRATHCTRLEPDPCVGSWRCAAAGYDDINRSDALRGKAAQLAATGSSAPASAAPSPPPNLARQIQHTWCEAVQCNPHPPPAPAAPLPPAPPPPDEFAIDDDVLAMLSHMSLEQKVGQMTQIDVTMLVSFTGDCGSFHWEDPSSCQPVLNRDRLEAWLRDYHVGSILNSPYGTGCIRDKCGWDVREWRAFVHEVQSVAAELGEPPILFGLDSVHGRVRAGRDGVPAAAQHRRHLQPHRRLRVRPPRVEGHARPACRGSSRRPSASQPTHGGRACTKPSARTRR